MKLEAGMIFTVEDSKYDCLNGTYLYIGNGIAYTIDDGGESFWTGKFNESDMTFGEDYAKAKITKIYCVQYTTLVNILSEDCYFGEPIWERQRFTRDTKFIDGKHFVELTFFDRYSVKIDESKTELHYIVDGELYSNNDNIRFGVYHTVKELMNSPIVEKVRVFDENRDLIYEETKDNLTK